MLNTKVSRAANSWPIGDSVVQSIATTAAAGIPATAGIATTTAEITAAMSSMTAAIHAAVAAVMTAAIPTASAMAVVMMPVMMAGSAVPVMVMVIIAAAVSGRVVQIWPRKEIIISRIISVLVMLVFALKTITVINPQHSDIYNYSNKYNATDHAESLLCKKVEKRP